MKKRFVINLLLFCTFLAAILYSQQKQPATLFQDMIIIKSEGIAYLGSGLSEDDAKTLALHDAKRDALERAGTYLESHTEVLNHQMVKDEIITFAGSIVLIKPLALERTLIKNMFAIRVEIEATIDTKILNKRISELNNERELSEQLNAERKRNSELEAQITILKTQGSTKSKQETKTLMSSLRASDWYAKGCATDSRQEKIEYFTKAIELDPQYLNAYIERGDEYNSLGMLAQSDKMIEDDVFLAILDYTMAFKIDPTSYRALNGRAHAFMNLGKLDSAIKDMTKVIEIQPKKSPIGYVNRGTVFAESGKYAEAIIDFSKAIELDPNNAFCYYKRGNAYYLNNNFEAAIRDYSTAIRLNGVAYEYYERGLVYADAGKHMSAIHDFTKAIEFNLDTEFEKYSAAPKYYYRAKSLYFLSEYSSAIEDLTKAITFDSSYVNAFSLRADINVKLNNYNAALADRSAVIRLSPNDYEAYWFRGLVYDALNQHEKAIRDYEEFLKSPTEYEFSDMTRNRIKELRKKTRN